MSYTTTIPKKNKIFEFSSPSRVPAAATPARARRRRRSARVSSLLTYFSLTSYLLRVSKDVDVPKVMVISLLGVICIFFKKKKTRAFFCVVSLFLSHSLAFASSVVEKQPVEKQLNASNALSHDSNSIYDEQHTYAAWGAYAFAAATSALAYSQKSCSPRDVNHHAVDKTPLHSV